MSSVVAADTCPSMAESVFTGAVKIYAQIYLQAPAE